MSRIHKNQARSGNSARAICILTIVFSVISVSRADVSSDLPQLQSHSFSQILVISGNSGGHVCTQGSRWSTEDFVCRPAEIAPTLEQRSIVITAHGDAIASLVISSDGFGTGRPVLGVLDENCHHSINLEDGVQEQIGLKVEFMVTPVTGNPRTVTTVLAQPQSARFLSKDRHRDIFELPMLEQTLATPKPINLGVIGPGDRIKLRFLVIGTMTGCENDSIKRQSIEANIWGPTSTQMIGYITTPESTRTWDDTKVAPFKVTATFSY